MAVGRYQLNYFEAERLCQIHQATLASLDQLTQAWQSGLELCRLGLGLDLEFQKHLTLTIGFQYVKERRPNSKSLTGVARFLHAVDTLFTICRNFSDNN